MPLLLDSAQSGPVAGLEAANCVTVGLINNMPDAALEATERQFTDLIRAGMGGAIVRLLRFYIPQVPRGAAARQQMAGRYRDVTELWDGKLDGLIVTGTEPKSQNLKDEPYWPALVNIIDWARAHTSSTVWSCLAAHAAVLQSDGIERRAFPEKLSGVFECGPADAHPMTRNVSLPMRVPHSRCNDLPEAALKSAGYRILTRSAEAGVDIFARQERSFHLFLQGHPEYEAETLLREYRRDVGRYLRGQRATYPQIPQGYFDQETAAALEAFHGRADAERCGEFLGSFPIERAQAGLAAGWRASAIDLFANWLAYLKDRKAERRSLLTPMRRAWRDWPRPGRRQAADTPAL
jgi:homoserine O-succinyltransferase/O-acetyltransferase